MTWIRSLLWPLITAAVVGAMLGGLGSMGTFFWANREMSPCAASGLDGVEQAVVVPMTSGVRRSLWFWGAVGAGVGISTAAFFMIPPIIRLRRVELGDLER